MDPVEMWPVFGLKVRTPTLTLRTATPDLAFDLANLAADGVHDPAEMPFWVPWTDRPEPELQRGVVRYNLRSWAEFRADSWNLPLAVFEGGELVGAQELKASGFPTMRSFSTGSWLGRKHQGRGIGREMRAAVLHLGFAGLGAVRATTDAYTDNPASLAVTRSLGYRPNGSGWDLRRGEPAEYLRFALERADWEPTRRDDIHLDGLGDAVHAFLEIDPV